MTENQLNIKKSPKKGIKETDVTLILDIIKGIKDNLKVDHIISLIQKNTLSDRSIKTLLKKAINSKAQTADMARIIEHLLLKLPSEKTNILTESFNDKTSLIIKILSLGEIKLLEILIKSNVRLAEEKDSSKKNLLFFTAEFPEMVNLLLKAGVAIDDIEEGELNSPLTFSASKGYKNTVILLIEKGANLNHVNSSGNCALFYAVKFNWIEVIKIILSHEEAQLKIENNDKINPINLALNMNMTGVYQMLVEELYRREVIIPTEYTLKNRYKKQTQLNDKDNIPFRIENQSGFSVKNDYNSRIKFPANNINQTGSFYNDTNNSPSNNKSNQNNQIINNYIHNQFAGQNLIISSTGSAQVHSLPNYENSNMTIEIPFTFKEKSNKGKKIVNELINFCNHPILRLDISSDAKQKALISSCNGDDSVKVNSEKISKLEQEKDKLLEEIENLKKELNKDKEEIIQRDRKLCAISDEMKIKDEIIKKTINENQSLIDKNMNLSSLNEKLEKENKELRSKKEEVYNHRNNISSRLDSKCLERKFAISKYEDKYSAKCLQRDLLDFQEITKDNIKKQKNRQDELIKLIQESIRESIVDYEIIIYGSHATQLCLPWSDIDLVLVATKPSANYYSPLHKLFYNIQEKSWKKVVKLIDNTAIPVLKITSNDFFNIDISVQDGRHYGIKCVELVKNFLKEYEVLEPLVLALKNILKQANLNDPYTVSYLFIKGRIKFLWFNLDDCFFSSSIDLFLRKSQLDTKKILKMSDLGMIFLEFLYYYGYVFDHSKFVIYAYPPNDNGLLDRETINKFYASNQSTHDLIIVDPLSKTNNVAKSTYQYINIKMAFMIAFVVAHEDCECGCHYEKNISEENLITNTEHCILKRIFLAVKRFNSPYSQS